MWIQSEKKRRRPASVCDEEDNQDWIIVILVDSTQKILTGIVLYNHYCTLQQSLVVDQHCIVYCSNIMYSLSLCCTCSISFSSILIVFLSSSVVLIVIVHVILCWHVTSTQGKVTKKLPKR